MGMTTLKRINREHIVTVNGKRFVFNTMHEALQYISEINRGK